MRTLGGFGGLKKVKENTTTPFRAFCSKKMGEANKGAFFSHHTPFSSTRLHILEKEKGERMRLQEFMDKYRDPNDRALYNEYVLSNKVELVDDFKKVKKAKERAPMRVKNISISRRVYLGVENITASVCAYYFLNVTVFLTSQVPSPVPGT